MIGGRPESNATPDIRAGQVWQYRAPAGYEASRLLVGAVVEFAERGTVICCAAIGVPPARTDNRDQAAPTIIPIIPMTKAAFIASVAALDEPHTRTQPQLPETFFIEFEKWQADPKGARVFNVPFEGTLDRMIALQMAEIANIDVA